MKRKKSELASIVLICLVSVLLALPSMVTGREQSSKPSSKGKPIVIKLITHQAPPALPDSTVPIFVDRVNARANGELIIKFMGGLEVIPLYEQPAALRSGAVDVITSPGSIIKDRIPEVMILSLSKKTSCGTPQTLMERKPGGVYEYVNKAFEKEGIHFLGRAEAYQPWYIMGKKKIQSIKDLQN